MAFYWRLKKKDYYFAAIELQKSMPYLKGQYVETIESDLRDTRLTFYSMESKPSPVWTRITLPLAFMVLIILFIGMPLNFMITGRWGYKWVFITNWFRSVGF